MTHTLHPLSRLVTRKSNTFLVLFLFFIPLIVRVHITRRKSDPTKGCKLAQVMFAIGILSISKRRRLSLNEIRWFSSVDVNSNNPTSLKKLIQPFVMKCHPDMAKQQGLPKTAQQVNLKAIQNLNSYVDGTISFAKGGQYPFSSYQSSGGLMEIEFVMAFTSTGSKAGNPTTSWSLSLYLLFFACDFGFEQKANQKSADR